MEKEKGHFRYLLIMYVLLIVVMASLFFLFRYDIKNNIIESGILEHYAIWKEEKSNTDSAYSVAIYRNESIINEERIVTRKTDDLHSLIEALLVSPGEDGSVSYIPEGTKLIGISEETGFFYVEFSSAFLSSSDISKAVEQVKRTLENYYTVQSLTVICGSTVIKV